jgi:hypothetical protein
MLRLVRDNGWVHLWLLAAALLPDGDRIDDDMTFAQAGEKVRRGAYDLRRRAKRERPDARRAFSAVGSLEKVDWSDVAYFVMCSVNPMLDKEYGAKAASAELN